MGFWEYLDNATPKFLTGKRTDNPSDHNNDTKQHRLPEPETLIVATTTVQPPYPYSLTALIKLTSTVTKAGAKNLTSYFPEPDRRSKISGAVTDFGKQTGTHAWQIPFNLGLAKLTDNPSDHNTNTKQHRSPDPEPQIVAKTTVQPPYPYSVTALIKLTSTVTMAGAKNLTSYFPQSDRRSKITGAVIDFGKQTVTHAWQIPYNIGLAKLTDNPSDHNTNTKQHRSPEPEPQIVPTTTVQPPYPYSLTALIKLTSTVTMAGAKNLTSYFPEPDRRSKISGAVTEFGKQAVTHAWQIPFNLSLAAALKANQAFENESVQNLKNYLPERDRREQITRIGTNIGGVQVYKIVKEGFKDESSSLSSNNEKTKAELLKLKVMEAKMKQMEEEFNTIKAKLEQQQQHSTSHKTEDGSVQQDTT